MAEKANLAKPTKLSIRQAWIRAKNAIDLKNGYAVEPNYVAPQTKGGNLEKVYFIETEPDSRGRTRHHERDQKNEVGLCTRIMLYSSLILLPIAFTLSVAGMAAPFWLDNGNISIGLFQACTGSISCSDSMSSLPSSSVSSTWIIVIVLHVVGTFFLMLAVIFLLCGYLNCAIGSRNSVIFGVCIGITALIGGLAIISAVLIVSHFYVAQTGYFLSWSFYFAVSGGAGALLVFCLFLIHLCMVTCK